MADVDGRPTVPGAGEHGGGRDRGQLILVTALSLAILFVALALILNTAIYTENLATRSSDIGGGTDAVRYHDAARNGVGGVIDYVNAHNNSSHSTLQSNLSAGVDAFRNHSARLFAAGDRAVETQLVKTVVGTRIAQSDVNRNFSNKSGAANWTVVSGVEHTRAFRMNVTRNALDSPSDQPFTIIVDDGNRWRMNVSNASGNIRIVTSETTCEVNAASAWINLSAETVGGTACEDLSFSDHVSGSYSIRFENGSNASGTYSFIVNQSTLADSPGPDLFADEVAGQPFAAQAIYSANVTVVYQTPRLSYNATVRVAPGESDG